MNRRHFCFVCHLLASALVLAVLMGRPAHAFDKEVHLDITSSVLRARMYDAAAIAGISEGNLLTDKDEFHHSPAHFDSEKFAAGSARLNEKLAKALAHLAACERDKALEEIGRCLHAIQDFFAHSNYIESLAGQPIDFFNLADPEHEVACISPHFKGPLTSGYWPDDRRPFPHKCVHAEIAKDGPDTGARHLAAKRFATVASAKFLRLVERRAGVRRAFLMRGGSCDI
jgi:hypothetical protein